MQLPDNIVKQNVMADSTVRQGIRNALDIWTAKLNCDGDAEKKLWYKQKFIKNLKQMPIAIQTDLANEQHYEVPTEFWANVLGKRMKYSSSLFPSGDETIDEAEEAMLSLVCDRARMRDGYEVMDLGCGWGVTALWILEKYPRCCVTCVSNSSTQGEHIREVAALKGFSDRLTVITADANVFETSVRFDRIISIEMLEHMKNYESLLERVSSWLKPDGLLFTHILCHREFTYHFKSEKDSDTEWMARHFFSGGTMPSSDLFLYFQKDLLIEDHWNINGLNYSKTLEAWLEKLDDNKSKVREIFAKTYSAEEVERQIANWRLFFMYCSEVFAYRGGNDWLVAHHLFKKRVPSKL